jgi:hypothetical protein
MTADTLTDATAVRVSGNTKTGPITVTSRSIATCPSTCPFLDPVKWEAKGCYAAGRLWHQVNTNARDIPISQAPRMTSLSRDRIVGDITVAEAGNDDIDWPYINSISKWAQRNRSQVFGYTHSDVWQGLAYSAWSSAYPNYVLRVSCHTPEEVLEAVDLGWPTVISSDTVKHGDMIGDHRVVECPENTHGVDCDRCGLCAKPELKIVILFPLHGTQVVKARAANAALEAQRPGAGPGSTD